jgi:hypothetical protein
VSYEPHPGDGLVFMKVGTHAREPLSEIIARKRQEIKDAGFALWGYGGNTCHPLTSVQPFARSFANDGSTVHLVMEEMESKHFAVPERAEEYSIDGLNWKEVPEAINVRGSRFALAIDTLEQDDFELPLGETRVAVGNQQGRRGDRYIKGRVDKACLQIVEDVPPEDEEDPRRVPIGLVARIVDPYAVLLRSH